MDKNKILRYIEGQLNGSDKEAFEVLIESNSELQLEVEMLANLIDNEPNENPPYELKQKIYKIIGIEDPSFMDVAIRKADEVLNIILGKEYFLDVEPVFVTRGNQESLLFSKKMNEIDVLCDIYFDENGKYLLNLAASKKNNKLDNIKFSIDNDKNRNIEKYTKSDGNTGSFNISSGIYYINISTIKSEIGNIKINLS
jgi:hypothetical protein